MSSPAPVAFYSIDTSSLMDWQARYYPSDIFTTLVVRMEGLIATERLRAPELVEEEIGAGGTAGLVAWSKSQPVLFIPTKDVLAVALKIKASFPGLNDPKAEYEEADAYVIALAQQRNGIVVTQETSAAEKRNPKRSHFIPDVCRELGIPCASV